MVHPRRRQALILPLFSLVTLSACGGGSGDAEGSSGSATTTIGTTGDATTAPVTTVSDDTTGPSTPPTTGPDDTTAAPTTDATDATTGLTTGATTEPATTDTTTDPGTTTGDTTTGGFNPADIPTIPDDGMPTSAHHKKVPLGTSEATAGFWEYTPPGYGGGELYPLLVFYHGIGENGNGDSELDKVLAGGPPKLISQDNWAKDRPFVVLSPQHPGGGCPSPTEIHDFFTFALSHYDINPARVYLTGLSCGAIGSWAYLGDYLDEQIVALVPIAGDGKGAFNKAACELGRVAIWAFHGDADNVVGVTGTTEPVTKLQMCDPKPDVDMVIYPGVGHDSWSMTYNLSAGHDIYAWLLEHYKTI